MKYLKLLLFAFLTINQVFADSPEAKEVPNNSLYQSMSKAEEEILADIEKQRLESSSKDNKFIEPKNLKPDSNTELLRLVEEVESLKTKVVLTKQNTLATKDPRKQKKVGSITYYNYNEGSIYELHSGVDRVSDIALQAGEILTSSPVAGDTVRWKIGSTESGEGSQKRTHIVVKPLEEGIETNLLITTNKRTYHIRALASDWYMPQIAWNYPDEELKRIEIEKQKANLEEGLSLSPENLRFRYKIKGDDYSWKPIRVFDDGHKTYLQMSKELEAREAPAFFVLDDGKEPRLTNYRIKGDYYIVDSLFYKAELRVGKSQAIKIIADDYKPSLFERIF